MEYSGSGASRPREEALPPSFDLSDFILNVATTFVPADTLHKNNIKFFLDYYDSDHQFRVDYERWESPGFVQMKIIKKPETGDLICLWRIPVKRKN